MFRWDDMQIQDLFMAFKRVPLWYQVVTLGQHYNTGEKLLLLCSIYHIELYFIPRVGVGKRGVY